MFPQNLNPHYQFDNPDNIAEIAKQDKFHEEGALMKMTPYIRGGGSIIQSPWGSNQSVECDEANENTVKNYLERFNITFDDLINSDAKHSGRAQPIEFCVKHLIVNPGNQLSLQVHQGREEFWIVKSGLLTVIVDCQRIDVNENQAIFIPKGAIHCMNNRTDKDVIVEELQLGICREEDNVRFLDSTRDTAGNPKPRTTYPLTTDVQYQSAVLFAELATEIALKDGLSIDPQFSYFL